METSSTLYSTILLLGSAHGIFLAFALLAMKSGNKLALGLLAALTLAFGIDLAINYLNVTGHLTRFPRLFFVESAAVFLYGPLLYFYVVALTSAPSWRLSKSHFLHFLPFVLCILLLIPYLRLDDTSLVAMIYDGDNLKSQLGAWAVGKPIIDVLPRFLIGAYLLLGFRRLAQHRRHIRGHYSRIEHINLTWLRNVLVAIAVLWVLYAIALAYGGSGPVEEFLNVVIVIVVYTLGYMGMRQPVIFSQGEAAAPGGEETSGDQSKYQRSALDEESSKALLGELQNLMSTAKPYLDSKLTLAQLAAQLGVSSNYLSQIINQQTGSNFFDFINSHRIEDAKAMLTDPDKAQTSVLTIAMDAGFNSKSAFYTAFKQHAGMTPSQYRQGRMS